jgi:hypothetical protein
VPSPDFYYCNSIRQEHEEWFAVKARLEARESLFGVKGSGDESELL